MVDIFYEELKPLGLSPSFFFNWLSLVANEEGRVIGDVSIIFTSDNYLLDINKKYLDHDYYTDIITFDYEQNNISGDLFISYDRVKENAKLHNVSIENEVNRVVVHGFLHLLGYKDKSPSDSELMTSLEDKYLKIVPRETL